MGWWEWSPDPASSPSSWVDYRRLTAGRPGRPMTVGRNRRTNWYLTSKWAKSRTNGDILRYGTCVPADGWVISEKAKPNTAAAAVPCTAKSSFLSPNYQFVPIPRSEEGARTSQRPTGDRDGWTYHAGRGDGATRRRKVMTSIEGRCRRCRWCVCVCVAENWLAFQRPRRRTMPPQAEVEGLTWSINRIRRL